MQGDVIAITNNVGTVVAKYVYDAWGKCTVTADTSGAGIANINPFRYRSYYYDVEIGLYYLQSRYYDPTVGRFINADDATTVSCEKNILSNNVFCYVYNSPSNETDENGNIIGTIIKKIIVGILKGIVICLILDLLEYLYEKYVFNNTDPFQPSPIQDYIESIYDEVLGELTGDFGLAFRTFVEIIQLAMKYLPKITSKKMAREDWWMLALDTASLLVKTLIEGHLSRSKKKQINELKRRRRKHKKNTYINGQIKSLKIQFKHKFIKMNISFDLSDYFLTFITDLIFA